MDAKETLIFGPPGCGKTYTLINIVKEALQNGTPPDRIGFVSFTRKSIEEARNRAGAELGLTAQDTPYFRTLHSMGFMWLGMRKDQIINIYDLKQIGLQMGMVFDNREVYDEDGLLQISAKEGNKYLTLIQRAKMRMIPLAEEFNDNGDYKMHWELLVKLDTVYHNYKREMGKFDFTDMIEQMVLQGTGPNLELLIVDEAQDLTPLQWEQVKVLARNAKRVYYAGDDDQAIFRYTGVDVRKMLSACSDKRVLEQSYRTPRVIHDLSASLARRIEVREPKLWRPRDEEGSIQHHMSIDELNVDQGSWTVMSRTVKGLNNMADELKRDGRMFLKNGRLSFDQDTLDGMKTWARLSRGEKVSVDDAMNMYSLMPKQGDNARVQRGMAKTLELIDPTAPLTFDDLKNSHGLLPPKDMPAQEALNLSHEDQVYWNALCRRYADGIPLSPEIKLSTIHRMKGGEDDNIVLMLDMGYMPYQTLLYDPDDEHRVFYTAVTRTKQNLHIIDARTDYGYPL
jgi:superfamily I DNA/RNA helicase